MADTIRLKRGTTAQREVITPLEGEPVWDKTLEKLFIGNGVTAGGINISAYTSSSMIIVETTDNPINNANALREAYSEAKLMTPNGSGLSVVNRVSVILMPGKYNFESTGLTLDTQYIDIIGFSKNSSDTILYGSDNVIIQTANDVVLANFGLYTTITMASKAAYFPNSDLPKTKLYNIGFVAFSDAYWTCRRNITYSGTYVECHVIDYLANTRYVSGMFGQGEDSVFSGKAIRCDFRGSNDALGALGVFSGEAIDCILSGGVCGSAGGVCEGIVKNCVFLPLGNDAAFGFGEYGGVFSGILINCVIKGGYAVEICGSSGGVFTGQMINCWVSSNGGYTSIGTPSGTGAIVWTYNNDTSTWLHTATT